MFGTRKEFVLEVEVDLRVAERRKDHFDQLIVDAKDLAIDKLQKDAEKMLESRSQSPNRERKGPRDKPMAETFEAVLGKVIGKADRTREFEFFEGGVKVFEDCEDLRIVAVSITYQLLHNVRLEEGVDRHREMESVFLRDLHRLCHVDTHLGVFFCCRSHHQSISLLCQ